MALIATEKKQAKRRIIMKVSNRKMIKLINVLAI